MALACFTYDGDYSNVVKSHERGAERDPGGELDLVLPSPVYNVRMYLNVDHAGYDMFVSNDMKNAGMLWVLWWGWGHMDKSSAPLFNWLSVTKYLLPKREVQECSRANYVRWDAESKEEESVELQEVVEADKSMFQYSFAVRNSQQTSAEKRATSAFLL